MSFPAPLAPEDAFDAESWTNVAAGLTQYDTNKRVYGEKPFAVYVHEAFGTVMVMEASVGWETYPWDVTLDAIDAVTECNECQGEFGDDITKFCSWSEAYGGGGTACSSSFIIRMDEYNQWISENPPDTS